MAGKREALAGRDIGTTRIQQRNRAPAQGKYQALKHVVSKENKNCGIKKETEKPELSFALPA